MSKIKLTMRKKIGFFRRRAIEGTLEAEAKSVDDLLKLIKGSELKLT